MLELQVLDGGGRGESVVSWLPSDQMATVWHSVHVQKALKQGIEVVILHQFPFI